jgi:hypothetical protein
MPLTFYFTCLVTVGFGFAAFSARREGWGIPVLAVLVMVSSWYFGDALYNDYSTYVAIFGPELLDIAWYQVLLFVTVFSLATPLLHRKINRNLRRSSSFIIRCYDRRALETPNMQSRLDQITIGLLLLWIALMTIALTRVDFNAVSLFAPYISGGKVYPWARARLGGGLDAIVSLADYLQCLLAAAFGIILAISTNPRTRTIAAIVCFLALPSYIFDRTRYLMIVTILPGFLTWVLLRVKGHFVVKVAILSIGFMGANYWLTFVIASRSAGSSISAAFESGIDETIKKDTKHEGFNMFEELAWIDSMIESRRYHVKWGQRYFAEVVNPIPRSLWKGKPLIGIEYAIARGQAVTRDNQLVTATISTGVIGQGIDNFGRFFGPLAAAIVVALWSVILARQDLLANFDPARILLYAVGLVMTFPMGRDISLLLLYPFFFGLGLLWCWNCRGKTQISPN